MMNHFRLQIASNLNELSIYLMLRFHSFIFSEQLFRGHRYTRSDDRMIFMLLLAFCYNLFTVFVASRVLLEKCTFRSNVVLM